MDKRLTAFLMVTYVVVLGMACADMTFQVPGNWATAFQTGVMLSFLIGLPAVFVLCVIFIGLAIRDARTGRQVVDGRYFTRCFLYRVASLVCVFFYAATKYAYMLRVGIAPFVERDNMSVADIIVPIFSSLLGIFLALLLSGTVTSYVILGVTRAREKAFASRPEMVVHIVMQLIWGFDLISLGILMVKECKAFPKEKIRWLHYSTARRERTDTRTRRPILVLFGLLLGFAAYWGFSYLLGLASTDIFTSAPVQTIDVSLMAHITVNRFIVFFVFLFAVLLWSILDARHHFRALPAELSSPRLIKKALFYVAMTWVLEIVLTILIGTIAVSFMRKALVLAVLVYRGIAIGYSIVLVLLVAAILLVYLSSVLYTRLIMKRCESDRVVSEKVIVRYRKLSLFPGMQVMVLIWLLTVSRARKDTQEITSR